MIFKNILVHYDGTSFSNRAFQKASDTAKETGGIILIKDDLLYVSSAIRLSRATMKKIKQNFFWKFACNSGEIPIAAMGLLNPILAIVAMTTTSDISNSSMLKRCKTAGGSKTDENLQI